MLTDEQKHKKLVEWRQNLSGVAGLERLVEWINDAIREGAMTSEDLKGWLKKGADAYLYPEKDR